MWLYFIYKHECVCVVYNVDCVWIMDGFLRECESELFCCFVVLFWLRLLLFTIVNDLILIKYQMFCFGKQLLN